MMKKFSVSLLVLAMLVIIWQYRSIGDINFPQMASNGDHGGVDWDVILKRLDVLRHHCGDLCDTGKTLNKVTCLKRNISYDWPSSRLSKPKHVSFHKEPGEFLGSITANVSYRIRNWEF